MVKDIPDELMKWYLSQNMRVYIGASHTLIVTTSNVCGNIIYIWLSICHGVCLSPQCSRELEHAYSHSARAQLSQLDNNR